MVEIVKENPASRPDAPKHWKGEWNEVLILPHDVKMTVCNEGWLQWGPTELDVIPRWKYVLLILLWPFLKLLYREPLQGQPTDR